ncbi:MAG: ABC transporter ATP-binding protein [Actinomycetota bacterium]|nr:ABC transporter ATP-binding protein [Actinomycetota bacterium]
MPVRIPSGRPRSSPPPLPLPTTAEHPGSCAVPSRLSVSGLDKAFGDVPVLTGMSMLVQPGEVVALVGPNGSGKSTALRCVTGLLAPDAGELLVDGHPVGSDHARRRTALVPDSPRGLEELTIDEFLRLFRALHAAPAQQYARRTTALVEAFNLTGRGRVLLRALSHGQRRQVSAVAALGVGPDLLVVDEAAAALDPEAVIVLREALRASVQGGASVLLATQDLHFAQGCADRFLLLHRGSVIAGGTLQELYDRFLPAVPAARRDLEGVFLAALDQPSHVEGLRDAFRPL